MPGARRWRRPASGLLLMLAGSLSGVGAATQGPQQLVIETTGGSVSNTCRCARTRPSAR